MGPDASKDVVGISRQEMTVVHARENSGEEGIDLEIM